MSERERPQGERGATRAGRPALASDGLSEQRAQREQRARRDVVVVGAGHNGLVAAILLARAGLSVEVLERADVVGGACRTEHPFGKAPGLAASTGAYLLGLMPPELLPMLGLDLPLVRRDPHYFLPTPDGRALLLGASRATARAQFAEFFSEADARADEALGAELARLREDLAPAWLAPPLPVEETAERFVRPALRDTFVAMGAGRRWTTWTGSASSPRPSRRCTR